MTDVSKVTDVTNAVSGTGGELGKTEFEKTELERYKLRTEGFILDFEHTEDEQTKAFIKLVKDTQQLIMEQA